MKAISAALFAAALLILGPMPALGCVGGIQPRPKPLSSHVHVISWPAAEADQTRNTTVIEQSDGLAVIDPVPTMPAGRLLVGAIRKLSRKPVKYLIYTHDRGRGPVTRMFLGLWPHLTVVATDTTRDDATGTVMDYIQAHAHDYEGEVALAREQLKRTDLLPEMRSGWQRLVDAGKSIANRYSNMKAYLGTLTFSDRLELPDRETPLEVLYLERRGGNGGAVVWAPTEKALYTGDIAAPSPHAGTDPLSWIRLADRIAAYDFAYLIPGQGEVETDRAYLGTTKASLAKVIGEVMPLTGSGATLADAHRPATFKSPTAS